jgi:hypothetical protein
LLLIAPGIIQRRPIVIVVAERSWPPHERRRRPPLLHPGLAVALLRTVLKRLGNDADVRKLLRQAGLWSAEFDKMLSTPLGFVPPFDEGWITKSIHVLAGETMAGGEYGHKKGYVYTWVLPGPRDTRLSYVRRLSP